MDTIAAAAHSARHYAALARSRAARALDDDQEKALTVAAVQFDSTAVFLLAGDHDQAISSLNMAHNYANAPEVGPLAIPAARAAVVHELTR